MITITTTNRFILLLLLTAHTSTISNVIVTNALVITSSSPSSSSLLLSSSSSLLEGREFSTPSCELNKLYGGDVFDDVGRQLIHISFDFCSEYEDSTPISEDVILLVDNTNCFPEDIAYYAHKAGAKRVVIETRFTLAGAEVNIFYKRRAIDIISVVIDSSSFQVLVDELELYSLNGTLGADINPWHIIFRDTPFSITYMIVFAVCALACTILAGMKLFFRVWLKGHKKHSKFSLAQIILLLEFISNLMLTCYNVVDPCFFRGIFSVPAAMTIIAIILITMNMSLTIFQLYWLKFTQIYNTSTFIFLSKYNLTGMACFSIFMQVITVISLALWAAVPPPDYSVFFYICAIACTVWCIPLMVIAGMNGIQVHRAIKGSVAIPQSRARVITIRMVTCAAAHFGLITSFMIMYLCNLESLGYMLVDMLFVAEVLGQVFILISSVVKISTFRTYPEQS